MNQSPAIEYFRFEQDFMEDNIRCIPMIVRFKLDACGIKLKLKEWSKMSAEEREQLAVLPIDATADLESYRAYLKKRIQLRAGESATELPPGEVQDDWTQTNAVPTVISEKLKDIGKSLSISQWQGLAVLQRYALVKLARSGHENKNFPKALQEFGLS